MFAIHCFNLLGVKDSVEFMLCFYGCLYFWCHFLKIMVLHQAMCLLYPASCIITHKLETVSIKLRQLLTVIYNWQYFPSPRKSELSELRIQDRLLTRDTGFNHCHLETRTIHWDQTIIPGRLLFSVLFLNSGRQWEQCRVSAQSSAVKRSIGFTIGFHNYREGPK